MLFLVKFIDKPDSDALRATHIDAHLAWFAEHGAPVTAAGPIRHDPTGKPIGGLWIVQAESRAEIEALYQTDPFWVNGLRESVEILHWDKAYPKIDAPI